MLLVYENDGVCMRVLGGRVHERAHAWVGCTCQSTPFTCNTNRQGCQRGGVHGPASHVWDTQTWPCTLLPCRCWWPVGRRSLRCTGCSERRGAAGKEGVCMLAVCSMWTMADIGQNCALAPTCSNRNSDPSHLAHRACTEAKPCIARGCGAALPRPSRLAGCSCIAARRTRGWAVGCRTAQFLQRGDSILRVQLQQSASSKCWAK